MFCGLQRFNQVFGLLIMWFISFLFQEREANLDIIMDRMRQDAAEATLKESLRKSLAMLDKIKDGQGKRQFFIISAV